MTTKGNAFRLFGLVVVGLLAVFALDSFRHRPHTIPRPVEADSLAGVVARVGGCDSALVHRVTWRQSPDAVLRWIKTNEYAYQGTSPWRDLTPLGAEADVPHLSVMFARGPIETETIKHELVHLLCTAENHLDTALFRRVEGYRGR